MTTIAFVHHGFADSAWSVPIQTALRQVPGTHAFQERQSDALTGDAAKALAEADADLVFIDNEFQKGQGLQALVDAAGGRPVAILASLQTDVPADLRECENVTVLPKPKSGISEIAEYIADPRKKGQITLIGSGDSGARAEDMRDALELQRYGVTVLPASTVGEAKTQAALRKADVVIIADPYAIKDAEIETILKHTGSAKVGLAADSLDGIGSEFARRVEATGRGMDVTDEVVRFVRKAMAAKQARQGGDGVVEDVFASGHASAKGRDA